MRDIRQILMTNPPAGDVYELITILLGYCTGSMIFVVLLLSFKCYIEHEQRTMSTDSRRQIEGVELEAFRPLENTSIASVCRLTMPTGLHKPVAYNVRDPSMWSIGTHDSELPPSYSASRARR